MVRLVKDGADRGQDLETSRRRQGARLLERLGEGLSLEQLHHQVGDAVVGDAEVDHRDGVRVIDTAGRDSLAPEACEGVGTIV